MVIEYYTINKVHKLKSLFLFFFFFCQGCVDISSFGLKGSTFSDFIDAEKQNGVLSCFRREKALKYIFELSHSDICFLTGVVSFAKQ